MPRFQPHPNISRYPEIEVQAQRKSGFVEHPNISADRIRDSQSTGRFNAPVIIGYHQSSKRTSQDIKSSFQGNPVRRADPRASKQLDNNVKPLNVSETLRTIDEQLTTKQQSKVSNKALSVAPQTTHKSSDGKQNQCDSCMCAKSTRMRQDYSQLSAKTQASLDTVNPSHETMIEIETFKFMPSMPSVHERQEASTVRLADCDSFNECSRCAMGKQTTRKEPNDLDWKARKHQWIILLNKILMFRKLLFTPFITWINWINYITLTKQQAVGRKTQQSKALASIN